MWCILFFVTTPSQVANTQHLSVIRAQNIDTLERRAGIDANLLVEAHGSFHDAHCIECHKEYSHQFVKGIHTCVSAAHVLGETKLSQMYGFSLVTCGNAYKRWVRYQPVFIC